MPTENATDNDELVDGDLTTGTIVRRVVYNRRTGVFHALTGDKDSDARIRADSIKGNAQN